METMVTGLARHHNAGNVSYNGYQPNVNSFTMANTYADVKHGCGYLDNPSYGYVKTTGLYRGSIARYYCHDNYELRGNPIRKCLYNGVWSGHEPTCKREYD